MVTGVDFDGYGWVNLVLPEGSEEKTLQVPPTDVGASLRQYWTNEYAIIATVMEAEWNYGITKEEGIVAVKKDE